MILQAEELLSALALNNAALTQVANATLLLLYYCFTRLALNNAALTQEIEALRDATVESKRAMAQVEP